MIRILCVEDYDENLFMLHRRLTRAGFEVAIATDGERVSQRRYRHRPT